jgi:uncharacterized protein
MTATPMCRSYICRDGTTRMPARRPRTFSAYRGAKRTRQQLILGPWTHGDRSLSHAGEVEFGPAAVVDGNLAEDFFALRRRWFDCWIKWQRNGVDDEPAASIFVMGGGSGGRNRDGRLEHGGEWRSGSAWPLPETRWTSLYLHDDRSLAAVPPEATAAALNYAFDSHRPAPTLGSAISSGEPVMRAGAYDHTAMAERPDVLVFTTRPLEQELEICLVDRAVVAKFGRDRRWDVAPYLTVGQTV